MVKSLLNSCKAACVSGLFVLPNFKGNLQNINLTWSQKEEAGAGYISWLKILCAKNYIEAAPVS